MLLVPNILFGTLHDVPRVCIQELLYQSLVSLREQIHFAEHIDCRDFEGYHCRQGCQGSRNESANSIFLRRLKLNQLFSFQHEMSVDEEDRADFEIPRSTKLFFLEKFLDSLTATCLQAASLRGDACRARFGRDSRRRNSRPLHSPIARTASRNSATISIFLPVRKLPL